MSFKVASNSVVYDSVIYQAYFRIFIRTSGLLSSLWLGPYLRSSHTEAVGS